MSKRERTVLKPPSKDVLRQLADLARVPPPERDFYYQSVRECVRTACERKRLIDNGLTSEHGERLLKSALSLQEALWGLSKHEAKLISRLLDGKSTFIFDRISGGGHGGLQRTAYQLALLFSLLTGKPEPRYPHQGPAPRKRGKSPGGRRPGSISNPILQDFIFDLWISTNIAGGKLSFAKNTAKGKPQGTILRAIELLAPYLPEGLVPKVLPSPTLAKLRAHCTKLEAQHRELESPIN
jgi:hypothetical protein